MTHQPAPLESPVLLDASVLISSVVGSRDGASALIVATAKLGGLTAVTVENALEETRRRLLSLLNAGSDKLDFAGTDKAMSFIRGAITVHPWVSPPSTLWPENEDDAYLLQAVSEHRPSCLVTLHDEVRCLDNYQGTAVLTPGELLHQLPHFGV